MNNSVVAVPRKPREMGFRTQMSAYLTAVDITATANQAVFITLSQFPSAAAFTAVFDQYRITKASVLLSPSLANSNPILAASTVTLVPSSIFNPPVLCTCVDQDDANAPANEAAVLAHESAIVHGAFTTDVWRTFQPRVAVEAYQTGGFGGFTSQGNVWCDSGSPAVQHYGLKWSANHGVNGVTGTNFAYVYLVVDVEFRKVF